MNLQKSGWNKLKTFYACKIVEDLDENNIRATKELRHLTKKCFPLAYINV